MQWQPKRGRKSTKVETGTPVKGTGQTRGGNVDSFQFKMKGDFDITPMLLSPNISAAVSVNHPTATGVRRHTQKESYGRPLIAFRFYDGVMWRQMIDCVGDGFDVEQPNEGDLMLTHKYKGPAATGLPALVVSGPGKGAVLRAVVSLAGVITSVDVLDGGTGHDGTTTITAGGPGTGATLTPVLTAGVITSVTVTAGGTGFFPNVAQTQFKPIDWPMFQGKIAGADVDIKAYKLSVKNDVEPRHTGRRSADPKTFDEGDSEVSGDILPDYESDTGSLFQQWEQNKEPGAFVAEYKDILNNIGSANFTNKSLTLTVNRPVMPSADPDMKPVRTNTSVKFEGHLDYTAGAALGVVTDNVTTSYVGA
jgi:hypothetical protein